MTVIYADTSALLKRVIFEPESAGVTQFLRERNAAGDVIAASSLAWLEVWRALRRLGAQDIDGTATSALAGIVEIPLTATILVQSRRVGPSMLRSLDAIHLSSAISVGAVAVLTHDDRLADAASILGFEVVRPLG